MKNKSKSLSFVIMVCVFSLFFGAAYAAEAVPGDACTTADYIRLSGGPETSGVGYYMVCQGGVWVRIFESDTSGYLGVGQASPAAPLHVGGEAIIGETTGLTCSATTEGAIRYNSTEQSIEVCDGSDWGLIRASACDNMPAYSTFTDSTNVATSTLTESDIVSITGMDSGCTATVGVSGDGSPEYRTCSDSACSTVVQAWTSSNNSLDVQGDYLQLRATSSSDVATAYTVTVSIGGISSSWSITTGVSGCSPEGTVCSDGTVYAGLSGASTAMYVTRCDAGQTWDGSDCTGTRSTYAWNNGNTSDYVETSVTSTTAGQTNTASLITIDSDGGVAGTQDHQAAQYCADLTMHGHSDWYLPSKTELDTIYDNNASIDNFDTSGTYYWSSSEDNNCGAWRQRFSDGYQANSSKHGNNAVRCARR